MLVYDDIKVTIIGRSSCHHASALYTTQPPMLQALAKIVTYSLLHAGFCPCIERGCDTSIT